MYKEHIVVAAFISLPIGMVVGLTEKQYSKRVANLVAEPLDGFYKVTNKPTGFKKGEILMLDPSAKFNPAQIVEIKPEVEEPEGTGDDVTNDTEADEVRARELRDAIFYLPEDGDPDVMTLSHLVAFTPTEEECAQAVKDHAEFVEELIDTINLLDPEKDYTEDGKPTVEAVNALLIEGESVSQDIVTAVFDSTQLAEENE